MLDARLRRMMDPVLDWVGNGLARLGMSANAITVSGFVLGMGAWAALALGHYPLALALILANRLADGLDGAVARRRGLTDLGGYLDIVLDFLFYAGVPFFFAVGQPDVAPVGGVPRVQLCRNRHLVPGLRHHRRQTRADDRGARPEIDLLPGRPDRGGRDHRVVRADVPGARVVCRAGVVIRRFVLVDHTDAHRRRSGGVSGKIPISQ